MRLLIFITVILCLACRAKDSVEEKTIKDENTEVLVEILSVEISGSEMNYTFNVEVKSPDTGCDQYADWWEVVTIDSVLKYRRILAHSHVSEQPFIRSGGPVPIGTNQMVIIRAHMNNLGYGTSVLQGSVDSGFVKKELNANFALDLVQQSPLPGDCPN